jgi:hypothetical protein
MHSHNQKESELEQEVYRLKRDRELESKRSRILWFLAIWLLPLVGMSIVQGDDLPKTAGPDLPVVGHMSIWGMWFLGSPIAAFVFRKIAR